MYFDSVCHDLVFVSGGMCIIDRIEVIMYRCWCMPATCHGLGVCMMCVMYVTCFRENVMLVLRLRLEFKACTCKLDTCRFMI